MYSPLKDTQRLAVRAFADWWEMQGEHLNEEEKRKIRTYGLIYCAVVYNTVTLDTQCRCKTTVATVKFLYIGTSLVFSTLLSCSITLPT